MTDFLVKKFVKNYENTADAKVREGYGALSSFTGIICNILLFAVKFAAGTATGAISVISDAFNNLSDSAGCIVTLIGYKMAAKPADKDHPFGHGRAEYLTSLIIAVIIFLVGFELMKGSAEKIAAPSEVQVTAAAMITLAASIGVKLWLSHFNRSLGRKIRSGVMLATAQDSLNDVIATSAAVIGLTASMFTDFPVDGIMGIIVSLFIIKAGFEILKDTADSLLGKPADRELAEKIRAMVTAPEKIIGVHDLVVHDYGPGRMLASCHAEVRSDESITEIHEIIDRIERDIYDAMGIIITIHTDPVDVDNAAVVQCRHKTEEYIKSLDERMSIHDFRLVPGEERVNIIFDVVVPFDCHYTDSEIKDKITEHMNSGSEIEYCAVITFDRDFESEE
ncbi:MAG: cation transporter [Oscillospiraceae bacterium]|nr:cation transporter [Oscillospiraceae bacterium]